MRWRLIGPFRGGRTVAVSGVPSQPGVFYFGAVDGGVWKSTDYGNTWKAIFDHEPTGSIGALAVAPSNPNIIYVGSGEGLRRPDLSTGDGIYKSTDAGRTWIHLGLRAGQQIGAIAVDPSNPDRLFAAVQGHPYGPNAERGVYRSLDGGRSFQRVLYRNDNTGSPQVVLDPANPQSVYAVLWASRYTPWSLFEDQGSGLYKSTDGGTHWTQLTQGLPNWRQDHLGRIGIGIAPSDPSRIYALVEASKDGGVYRSDDAGASWRRINTNRRLWGRGWDFAGITVDPIDANTVYIANTSTYRSTDGGQTFTAIKGAPGGDDYHTVWIDPRDRNIIILGVDQGATISVNRGRSWSSWYNQPTGQMYHVATDNAFPFDVYSGQQESGSVGIASRGMSGDITLRDWEPVGAQEYADIAPDPLNPDIIYGAGGGSVSRFSKRTHLDQNVSPHPRPGHRYRFRRTMPLVFSPVDPHALYLGAQRVLKTTDGGAHWSAISPDLTRRPELSAPTLGPFRFAIAGSAQPGGGVVYALSPSPLDAKLLWAGTDDGLIWVTRDGGAHWSNVTPPQLQPWWKVSSLDASPFDPSTCYAAINTIRLDEMHPHLFRTHDGGKTWTEIDAGLPDGAATDVVRADPKRRGLLYAGTETSVYVSFDDGGHWQPLQLNLPHTSMRDLEVHDNDLIVATHGRSFWILDDLTPLRQITAQVANAAAYLFRPEPAYRMLPATNEDTPFPPEVPAGRNPPNGAVLDYYLRSPQAPVTLAIYDAQGKLVRRYSSTDQPAATLAQLNRTLNIPTYWLAPFQRLAASAGMHRFVWDLRTTPPAGQRVGYAGPALPGATPLTPRGILVVPGTYTATLTVGGRTYTQPLVVKLDPRIAMNAAQLQRQYALASGLAAAARRSQQAMPTAPGALRGQLARLGFAMQRLAGMIDGVDAPPTPFQVESAQGLEARLEKLLGESH